MKKNLHALIFFLVMFGFALIVLPGESRNLSERESGKTVEIDVGDKLDIVLAGNPTTGFVGAQVENSWEILRSPVILALVL